jgi:hypothetical protein
MSGYRHGLALSLLWLAPACGGTAPPRATPAPAQDSSASAAVRPASALPLDSDGRLALATLKRLDMVTSGEESSSGVLRLHLGQGWNRAAAEYHLSHLFSSYALQVEPGHTVALELWQGDAKIGEYTADGLLIGSAFADPR